MRKLFLTFVAALMAATASLAQSSLLATLSHEGNITTYYGASALSQAHAAAAHGDIITLSSGSFNPVNITKAITLRGAGMEVDATKNIEPTVISGDFNIDIPTEVTERLTIEGIYHNATIYYKGTLTNATFLKSRLNTISPSSGTLKNATFIHCRVANQLNLNASSSATCVNCVIWNPNTNNSQTSNFEMVNCVLYKGSAWDYFYSSSLKSCILIATDEYSIPASCTVYNCVGVYSGSTSSKLFANVPNSSNTRLKFGESNPFATYTGGSYSDSEKFELTEDAQTKYLGTDGSTQVGIYGGTIPYSTTPSNPQITKCNVAAKSTADGKLSVDIEVSSAE